MKREDKMGIRKLYRKQEEGKERRWAARISGKADWFRKKGDKEDKDEGERVAPDERKGGGGRRNQGGAREGGNPTGETKKKEREIETVIFVPHTPGGSLRKQLPEEDDRLTEMLGMKRVRFVERGGVSIAALLCRSNPWREQKCKRANCQICRGGKGGECHVESVVYQVECLRCKEALKRRVYIGETGRSGYERGVDHWNNWRRKHKGSFLHKHDMMEHDGKLGREEVVMTILSKPRKALSRQIEEAVRIAEEDERDLMNSKSMFRTNRIPRITIAMGDKVRMRRKDKEEEKKKREEEEREKANTRNVDGRECLWYGMEEESSDESREEEARDGGEIVGEETTEEAGTVESVEANIGRGAQKSRRK